jgi:hypothetical protein
MKPNQIDCHAARDVLIDIAQLPDPADQQTPRSRPAAEAVHRIFPAGVSPGRSTWERVVVQPAASADETTPSQCLVGERPPASVVAQVQLNPSVRQAIYLRCGATISTGVLHIDTRHPVADQDADFVT